MPIGKPIKKISGVTVIMPDTGETLEKRDILIDGGRIESIKPAGNSKVKSSINGEGLASVRLFAIPGLIDTHVHSLGLFTENLPGPLDIGWVVRQQLKNLAAFLRAGVTTIRDMGAPLKLIRMFSERAGRLEIKSPKILFAGPVLSVSGGYPYFIPESMSFIENITGPVVVRITGAAHARKTVDRLAAAGAHCIKVCRQSEKYDNERTPLEVMPVEWMEAIIERAHRRGLPVAVHHIYKKDLSGIIDLPFDFLEHIAIDEEYSDEEIKLIARKGAPVSATMMTYGIIDHLDRYEEIIQSEPARFEAKPRVFLKRALKAIGRGESASRFIGTDCIKAGSTVVRKNVKRLFDAGSPIVNGTDSGGAITPTGCPHWELIDMVRAGLSPLDALRAATTVAARALGMPDLGALAPGAAADIALLRANPLENIEAVGDVAAVIRDGRLAHRAGR